LQEESSEVSREQAPQGGGDGSRTRHHVDLHRSEDRLEEAVEAEQPRPWKASSGVPGERVPQGGERGGWPDSCRRAQHQADLPRRVGTAVSRKRRLPSGSERWREAKRRPAQRLSCEARRHGFVCLQEVAAEAAQGEQSGCRENVTPAAAEEGESGDESDLLTEDRDRTGLRGSASRGSRRPRGWDPGGLLMGAQKEDIGTEAADSALPRRGSVRSLSVSSFIEKELRMQLRMKRKRKGEREEKETPPAWEQTVNILFMHGVIAQGKRAPGGGGFLSESRLHKQSDV
jgi:hypothetical protein